MSSCEARSQRHKKLTLTSRRECSSDQTTSFVRLHSRSRMCGLSHSHISRFHGAHANIDKTLKRREMSSCEARSQRHKKLNLTYPRECSSDQTTSFVRSHSRMCGLSHSHISHFHGAHAIIDKTLERRDMSSCETR